MPIRLVDRLGCFANIVILTELVWYLRQRLLDRSPDALVSITDSTGDQNQKRVVDFTNEIGNLVLTLTQEAPRKQRLTGEAVPQHLQDCMPNIGFQAIQSQNDLVLRQKPLR